MCLKYLSRLQEKVFFITRILLQQIGTKLFIQRRKNSFQMLYFTTWVILLSEFVVKILKTQSIVVGNIYEFFENVSLIRFLAQSELVGLLYSFFILLVRKLLIRGLFPVRRHQILRKTASFNSWFYIVYSCAYVIFTLKDGQ